MCHTKFKNLINGSKFSSLKVYFYLEIEENLFHFLDRCVRTLESILLVVDLVVQSFNSYAVLVKKTTKTKKL